MALILKSDVNVESLARELWFALGVWYAIRHVVVKRPLIISSADDGKHMKNSLHYTGHAFDIRVFDVTGGERDTMVRMAREILDPLGFDHVSRENPTHQDHDHLEWDPKEGEEFIRILPVGR